MEKIPSLGPMGRPGHGAQVMMSTEGADLGQQCPGPLVLQAAVPEGAGAAGRMPLGGQQAGKAACRARKPRALSCTPGLPIAGRSSPGAPQMLSTRYSGRAAVEVLGAGAVSPTPRDRQAEPFVLSAGRTPGGGHSARLWPVALAVTPRALGSQPLCRCLPEGPRFTAPVPLPSRGP